MDELLLKLNKLREEYSSQEDQEIIADWEKKARLAVLTSNLQHNDAMKIILGQYRNEIAMLDKLLTTDTSLFKDEPGRYQGLLIHERKKWCKKFIQIFTTATAQIESVHNAVGNFMEK